MRKQRKPWRLGIVAVLLVSVSSCSRLGVFPGKCTAQEEKRPMAIADFAQEGELQNWKLRNSGPKSKIELIPGPKNTKAVQVTCVYERQLSPQAHSPAPYMPFRRAFDGEAAAKGSFTRMSFWHRGDGVQVVFAEKDRGDVYYRKVGDSPNWRRVFVSFTDLALGWSQGGAGKGSFDLARMDAMWLAVAPAPGKSKTFAVADFRFEWSEDDLSPLVFIGSTKPHRLDLYPRKLDVPINRSQPLLVLVRNEKLCGLRGVEVELSVEGAGDISTHGDREGKHRVKSLRLVTNDEGKAQARFHPTRTIGESCVITARITGTPSVAPSVARFTAAPEFHKVTLGRDGFFVRPDGKRIVLLGGQFLPMVFDLEVVDGRTRCRKAKRKHLLACDDAIQRAWFRYFKENSINCLRGWWTYGRPLITVKLNRNGTAIKPSLCLDGKVNEPVVAALERALAIAGQYGIGVTLTLFDEHAGEPGTSFIKPGRKSPEGKSQRACMHEALEYLRGIVPRLMYNPNIWAFELLNEQAPETFEWSELFIRTIQELDEVTPVMVSHGGGGLRVADPLAWMSNTSIDVYQPHFYPGTRNTSPDVDTGLFQEVHANAMQGPKPWLLGESGGYSGHPPLSPPPGPVVRSYLARDCIWFALLNRSIGAFFFCHNPEENAQIRIAAEIVPLVDWKALRDARAMVGVAVPRDISKAGFFRSAEGEKALKVMADYARWGLEQGVTVDFVLDAGSYDIRRSASAFDPPEVKAPFSVSKGYQFKYRMSEDGRLVAGYLRNVAEISLVVPPGKSLPSGSYIRVRKPLTAELKWKLPAKEYSLMVWDLDTGKKIDIPNTGQTGTWRQERTGHDFLLIWKATTQ